LSNLKALPNDAEKHEVDRVLKEASDAKYESFILFGYKDKKIYVMHSGNRSTIEIVGALEMAKAQLLSE
jgi:hypothetical protein